MSRKNKYTKEYNEYVKNTPMAEKEKEALRKWVMDGNSVHDNPSMSVDEHNRPTDFLDDYRYHEEIYQHLEQLTGKNRENYNKNYILFKVFYNIIYSFHIRKMIFYTFNYLIIFMTLS